MKQKYLLKILPIFLLFNTITLFSQSVVINEIVTDPQSDWSANGFNGTAGAGTVSNVDEYVELYIKTSGLNLTNWTIELLDGTNVIGDLTSSGAFDVSNYVTSGSGSFTNTEVGDYLILGNVDGSGAMNNSITINLKDSGGTIIDTVTLGGGAGEAPNGNATSTANEAVIRTLNGNDTNIDSSDFSQGTSSIGSSNSNTVNWLGKTDNDWATASNWEGNSIPGAAADVYITNGLTNYPTASSAVTINSVVLNSGASLIAQSTFTGSVSYSRTLTTNWHLVSSPVGSQDINTFTVTDVATNAIATSGANYGVAPYDNNGSAWAYYTTGTIAAAGNFIAGKGYSTLRTSAGDITFTGTMPTNDVAIAITDGTANEWNLIGNPYPSYIPANSGADATNNFITVNTADLHASYQAVYFWNGSAYVAVNHADGARFIAPGQGFFVNSVASGSTVDFTEAMQSHQTTDVFSKAQTTWPEIVVHMTDGASDKSTKIKYISGTTRGLDPGYDAGMFTGVSNTFSVYSHLVSNSEGVDFTLQALPDNDYENISVPIGFNAVSGKEITFSVNHKALPQGLMVFLEDTKDNKIIRLDESNANYKITLTNDNNGIGRFYLRTSTTDLSKTLNVDKFDLSNINIYLSSDRNIRITGVQGQSTNVKLFSILGKRVLNKNNAQTNSIIDITIPSTVKNGIYILKLETEKGNISKKLFIK